MTGRYIIKKVNITDIQVAKIKNAIHKSKGVTIQFSIADLQVENPTHTLALTKGQSDKLAKALSEGEGVRITMSKTRLEHNRTIEGGFIGPLVAGLASAVLPSIASFIMDKISGKGIFMKRGTSQWRSQGTVGAVASLGWLAKNLMCFSCSKLKLKTY
jgi:hypothetical protein